MAPKLSLGLALVVVLGMPVMLPQSVAALPNQQVCRITTYYKEASLTNVVGTRTTCPVKLTGHTSRYSEVEVIVVDNHTGGGGGAGGGMPCEFVADGTGKWDPQNTCQNLPIQRGSMF
jgi:hypothetical protein